MQDNLGFSYQCANVLDAKCLSLSQLMCANMREALALSFCCLMARNVCVYVRLQLNLRNQSAHLHPSAAKRTNDKFDRIPCLGSVSPALSIFLPLRVHAHTGPMIEYGGPTDVRLVQSVNRYWQQTEATGSAAKSTINTLFGCSFAGLFCVLALQG